MGSTDNEQEIRHGKQYSFTATDRTIRRGSDDAFDVLRRNWRADQCFGLVTEASSERKEVVWPRWQTLLRPEDHAMDLEEAPTLSRSAALEEAKPACFVGSLPSAAP
jgi:hypothetical protein